MIKRKYILFRKKEQQLNLLIQPNSETLLFAQDYDDLKKAITLKNSIETSILALGQCFLLPLASRVALKIQSIFKKQPALILLWFPTCIVFLKFNLLISRLISQPYYWPYVKRTALRVRERQNSQRSIIISESQKKEIEKIKSKSYSWSQTWKLLNQSQLLGKDSKKDEKKSS